MTLKKYARSALALLLAVVLCIGIDRKSVV